MESTTGDNNSSIALSDHGSSYSDEYGFSSDDQEDKETTSLLTQKRPDYMSNASTLAHQEPVTLTWENLNVSVPEQKKSLFRRRKAKTGQRKHILENVSGAVESGQLVAILGASGSGKSTLLNVLTARNVRHFVVNGRICVNGREMGRRITSISAYVQQNDLFVGTLTVREHLVFQALLRLPSKLTWKQKVDRADEVIFDLGLTGCAGTRIGVQGMEKGISGGESKRLAFASEVLTNPQILFCDEPTTGIDSFMAQSVVSVLQKLAAKGKIILCTIHQPASELYAMFDRIMFLAEGRVAYAGSASNALEFFARQGYRCPENYNPADFFIHTLALVPSKVEESKRTVEKICEEYDQSEFFESTKKTIAEGKQSVESEQTEKLTQQSTYKASWPLQFLVLLWRSLLFSFRNKRLVRAKVIQKLALGLFVGLLYLQMPLNQQSVMNFNGALFFILAEMTFPTIFGILTVLPLEFPILVREHHNGMYRINSYYLAKVVSFIPSYSIDAIIFVVVSYFMIGLRPGAEAFFTALGISLLIAQTSVAFGFLVSSFSPTSTALSVAVMTPVETLLMLVGGFFANSKTIPSYISWIQYISWFRYGYESLEINQWHKTNNITCETPEMGCYKKGDDVLNQLGFAAANLEMDLLLMFALLVGFHLVGYFALWSRAYRAR